MPFSKSDTFRVIAALQLSLNEELAIQRCLETVEQQSEHLTQQVRRMLDQMEGAVEEWHIASTEDAGILKIQGGKAGIEYDPHRACEIKQYLSEMRSNLANRIGYEINVMSFPF